MRNSSRLQKVRHTCEANYYNGVMHRQLTFLTLRRTSRGAFNVGNAVLSFEAFVYVARVSFIIYEKLRKQSVSADFIRVILLVSTQYSILIDVE